MKIILSAVLLLTLGLNTIQASCVSDFETKTDHNISRDGAVGGVIALISIALPPLIGVFALIPMSVSAAWVLKDLYLPSSATKMTRLISDSQFLIDYPDLANATLKLKPHALRRLDLVVKRATDLTKKDGDQFILARQKVAEIISSSNKSRELCESKLVKFSKVDEFVKAKF